MKKIKLMGTVVLLSLMALVFTGCDWISSITAVLAAPQGYVYSAEDGSALENVTVQLKNTDGTVAYTATTSSTGYYTFTDIDYGTFELTGLKTGYAFTKKVIEVSGLAQTLPNIGGFVPGDEVFRIVVFWDRDFADVDSFLSMPTSYSGQATVDSKNFYDTASSTTPGFFPADSGRQVLSYSNPTIVDGTYTVATKDVDNTGAADEVPGGPETISVFTFPFYNEVNTYDYTPVESDRSGLPITNSYAWVGTMEYYLDAFTGTNTNSTGFAAADPDALLASATIDGEAANPVVYIFDGNGVQQGYFTLPAYQNIKTASILRINMYYDNDLGEWYQFLPQVQAFKGSSSIRSLDENSSVFAFQGKKRN